MHSTGLVFGAHIQAMMNSLTDSRGYGREEIWVPLDIETAGSPHELTARSGWAITNTGENLEVDIDDDWVMLTWPTDFLRSRFGSTALLGSGALASKSMSVDSLKMIDGQWHAGLPRFFSVIGDHWSLRAPRDGIGLINRDGDFVGVCTVAEIDMDATLKACGPSLLVGPLGPLLYRWDRVDFDARLPVAVQELLGLPCETPVWLVDWHH